MYNVITPLILAGGQGTRLWPISRTARPKQFLPLFGERSLFRSALGRVRDPQRYGPPIVVTNSEHRFLVAEQLQEEGVADATILLEPVARNTAAAIAAAACLLRERLGPEALMHVLASDHAVEVDENYLISIATAAETARRGKLVTFGITPTSPETGYGYIEAGAPLGDGVLSVARFVEKPDEDRAAAMIAAGNHYWNSGVFLFEAGTFLAEIEALAPATLRAARAAVTSACADLDFVRLDEAAFSAAPDISVDYAVFEKSDKVALVPVTFAWSDLGTWDKVWKVQPKDADGNVALSGAASFFEARNALVVTDDQHVTVQGLDDVVVAVSDDAVYVGRLASAQQVGTVVRALRSDPGTRGLTEVHRTAYRPWGGYSSVLNGERFQVKRLFVKPGKKLSLQKHFHRAEHWVVVAGTAEVTRDNEVLVLTENQSIYLPLGAVHRLANPGKIQLELIEVQTGAYLGEDDIVRLEDEFGRI